MLLVFPELYLHRNYSFIRFQDTEFLYSGFFTFLQSFDLGRIQLWNNYDQMPFTFFYVVGMMTYTHAISAALFWLTSGFSPDTGRFLYDNMVYVFNVIPMLVRAAGMYLLLSLLIQRRWLILLTSVLAGSFFNPQFHFGLNCTALYSMLPLVLFFLLRYATRFEMRDLLAAFLLVAVGVAVDPLVGLGYFYQGIHFFVLAAIVWVAVANRARLRSAWQSVFRPRWKLAVHPRVLLTALLTAVVVLPWVYLLRTTYGDYELAHETSRFANVFNLLGYFERSHYGTNPWILLRMSLDFTHNDWVFQWVFIGFSAVFFAICGAVLSRDSRKYIFILTIVFFWLLQFPREMASVTSLAHWLNALTNPFNSVVRTGHMTGAFLLPTMVAPLFALGIDRICSAAAQEQPGERGRVYAVVALLGLAILWAFWPKLPYLSSLPPRYIAYVVAGAVVALTLLLVVYFFRRSMRVAAVATGAALAVLLATDIGVARIYFSYMGEEMEVVTHEVQGIAPELNPVGLDYQNPLIRPLREQFVHAPLGQVKYFVRPDPVFMQGNFYRYTFLEKFFVPASQYTPRHTAYVPLSRDHDMQEYLRRNGNLTFFAEHAVAADRASLREVLDRNLERRVVLVQGEKQDRVLEQLPARPGSAPADRKSQAEWVFTLKDAHLAGDGNYVIALPSSFPPTLASSIFSPDRQNLSLDVGGQALKPAQGWISRPLQYDVQNIKKGTLHFSLPADLARDSATPVRLRYSSSAPLNSLSVITYEPDRLKFALDAERDGWLVVHQPFDPKWSLKVNGADTKPYRANAAFLATPISKGRATVELEYMPSSYLRPALALSLLLSMLVLVGAFMVGARRP